MECGSSKHLSSDETKDEANEHIYKKRSGTSGVTGQLYETKLLSLILFRALNDEDLQEFYIGNNIDEIGALDDICLKLKLNNEWVAVFIQAKHRDDSRKGGITDNDLEKVKGDFSLRTYFESFIKIKQKFDNIKLNHDDRKVDKMFTGKFDDIKCFSIIYTPVAGKITKKKSIKPNCYFSKIRNLISSCPKEDIFQINYDNSDINILANFLIAEQLNLISKALLECSVTGTNKQSYETIKTIQKYQSFLIPNIIEIQQKDNGESIEGKIKPAFLDNNSYPYIQFREILFEDLLKASTFDESESRGHLYHLIYYKCCDINILSKIIGRVVVFNQKTGTLELTETLPETIKIFKKEVYKIPVSHAVVREAYNQAGKEGLLTVKFKLQIPLQILVQVDNTASKIETDCGDPFKDTNFVSFDTSIFCEEKKMARDFLKSLFFCTKEAKQDEVEDILIKEIEEHNQSYQRNELFRVHAKGTFLKLHDKIQKWSMLQGKSYYLTKSCDFLMKSNLEILITPFLTTSNFDYTNELMKYPVKFKDEIINKLKLGSLRFGVTIITTNTKELTCIKLVQYFKSTKYSFLDFRFVSNLTSKEFQMLLKEIKIAELDVLILIFKTGEHGLSNEMITRITEQSSKKVIVVNNELPSTDSEFMTDATVIIDIYNNFVHLIEESQIRLLNENTITVQGQKVPLRTIIDDKCKHLIGGDILFKLMKNEIIVVGKTLQDKKYENIKNSYMPRCVSDYHSQVKYEVNNIKDINDLVVIITAEPGMGKSTLITHLCIETKIMYPKLWIVRINLLDHSPEFLMWKNQRRDIDLKDTMTLVCKSELGNVEGNFNLEVTDGILALKSCNITGTSLLNLELIIHCFNNGDIVFLFDGFDEIFPHHKKEVVKFIKNVMPNKTHNYEDLNIAWLWEDKKPQRYVWITSRPYNAVKMTLEVQFGVPHQLVPLSSSEQQKFYPKYFKDNIILHELSAEQFINIQKFFEFMSQYRLKYGYDNKLTHVTSIPLHSLYSAAVDYFYNAVFFAPPLEIDIEQLRNELFSSKDLLTWHARSFGNCHGAEKFEGVPLHMNIAANYFVSKIKTTVQKDNCVKWGLNVNTFDLYENFFETKLKTIRLEEKNRRHTSFSDEIIAYEKEKKDFMESHKKLGFYALFRDIKYFRKIISKMEYCAVKDIIKKISNGEEKTGLIDSIYDSVPRFIHLVFAEYFACEYIADKVKSDRKNVKRRIINFIMNSVLLRDRSIGVMTIFDQKLKQDGQLEKSLTDFDSKKNIFEYLMKQSEMMELKLDSDGDPYEENIKTSLFNALGHGLGNVTKVLINSLEGNLNEGNLEKIMGLLSREFFFMASLLSLDEVIVFVLDLVRTLDPETVRVVFRRSDLPFAVHTKNNDVMPTNEEILKNLQIKVKSAITPVYYFDGYDDTLYHTT